MSLELSLERGEKACNAERSPLLVLRISSGGTVSAV